MTGRSTLTVGTCFPGIMAFAEAVYLNSVFLLEPLELMLSNWRYGTWTFHIDDIHSSSPGWDCPVEVPHHQQLLITGMWYQLSTIKYQHPHQAHCAEGEGQGCVWRQGWRIKERGGWWTQGWRCRGRWWSRRWGKAQEEEYQREIHWGGGVEGGVEQYTLWRTLPSM